MGRKNNKPYIPGSQGKPRIYCGGCKCDLGIPNKKYNEKVGTKIKCPKSTRYNYHIARIINNKPGEFWVTLENSIAKYELSYSPYRLVARLSEKIANFLEKKNKSNQAQKYIKLAETINEKQGLYTIIWYLVLVDLIFSSGFIYELGFTMHNIISIIFVLIALFRICDIIIVGISSAYIRQIPAHRLRSVVFSLVGISHIVMCFSIFYLLFAKYCFDPPLSHISALYLSLMVTATLGYTNFNFIPNSASIPQIIIINRCTSPGLTDTPKG